MPKARQLTALQAFTAIVAIAQDHGIDVSLEPHEPCALPKFIRSWSPGAVNMAYVFPPADMEMLVARIHTQCGFDIAAECAYRRWEGSPAINKQELESRLYGFAAQGFDDLLCRDVQKIWRSGTELEAALMLLRWAAVVYWRANLPSESGPDGPAISCLVSGQAGRLLAVAEASLDAEHIRKGIERLAPAMLRGRSMTTTQLSALTADLPRTSAFAQLDWPWLTQHIAARGTDVLGPGDHL